MNKKAIAFLLMVVVMVSVGSARGDSPIKDFTPRQICHISLALLGNKPSDDDDHIDYAVLVDSSGAETEIGVIGFLADKRTPVVDSWPETFAHIRSAEYVWWRLAEIRPTQGIPYVFIARVEKPKLAPPREYTQQAMIVYSNGCTMWTAHSMEF